MLAAWLMWLYGNPVPAIQRIGQWVVGLVEWIIKQLEDKDSRDRQSFLGNFQAFTRWYQSANRARNAVAAKLWWLYVRCYIDVPQWLSQRIAADEVWANR